MEIDELSIVSREILNRISILKKSVEESMVVGDSHIVRGIILFEEVLKTINPVEINEDIISNIQMGINDVMEKRELLFNSYFMLGIKDCLFIVYDYNIIYKKRKLG